MDSEKIPQFVHRMASLVQGSLPPILAVIALIAGVAGLIITPKEEDPQISVPFADVMVEAPGLSAAQVERQVTIPLENLLYQLDGVEYVYSMSQPGQSIVTVRFYVGQDLEESLVRIYDQIESNRDKVPESVSFYVVKPRKVDDIPILMASLYSRDEEKTGSFELRRLAEEVAIKLQSVPNTNAISVTGGLSREVLVEIDREALATRQTTPLDLVFALGVSNQQQNAGVVIGGNQTLRLETGAFFKDAQEIGNTVVNVVDGIPVYLSEVATVTDGSEDPEMYSWMGKGPAWNGPPLHSDSFVPSVSLSVGKRHGTNAVTVSRNVMAELEKMKKDFFPPEVDYTILRDYGQSASEKVSNLVTSLLAAIIIVIIFVGLVMGWRAALVVGLAVPISYGLTLGLNYFSGYTINRVTLFALILSLGLLVDDPITGVDNIDRHLRDDDLDKPKTIGIAMNQVRNALIMSTLAIIASFLPLSFITGLMGPYMAPMALNVPVAVTMSTVVAFLVTPWMSARILKSRSQPQNGLGSEKNSAAMSKGIYDKILRPLVTSRLRAWVLLISVGILFVASLAMGAFRLVPLKLLPFDNNNELQVLIDLPEGASLEKTQTLAQEIGRFLETVPEVESFAAYVGEPSPIDLNGLVRQYYLRQAPNMADIRVRLAPSKKRAHGSHDIALRLHRQVTDLAHQYHAKIKLVEVPPGPPVMATIVAEIYGDDTQPYSQLQSTAAIVERRLVEESLTEEVDTTVQADRSRFLFVVDKEKAALSGIATEDVNKTLGVGLFGYAATYLQLPREANPLPVMLRLPVEERTSPNDLLTLSVKGRPGYAQTQNRWGELETAPVPLVQLGELGEFNQLAEEQPIYHKNLRPVVYTTANSLGRAPADVILDVVMDEGKVSTGDPVDWQNRTYINPGANIPWVLPDDADVNWGGEGELKITLRVFRDLGIAFAAAMIAIFIILMIQTGSVVISGIIMLAIPLSFIGILPGFWLLNQLTEGQIGGYPTPTFFTATAMIGMIALAGIVVRNSLILVEFIQEALADGMELTDALVQAGAIRARPILLTAGTTLFGNIVITLDPIFSGLAWAIIFGIATSTLFTLLVIPIVYYLVFGKKHAEMKK